MQFYRRRRQHQVPRTFTQFAPPKMKSSPTSPGQDPSHLTKSLGFGLRGVPTEPWLAKTQTLWQQTQPCQPSPSPP